MVKAYFDPDADVLLKDGDTFSGDLTSDGSSTIKNLPAPSDGTDAATKDYVDTNSSSRYIHDQGTAAATWTITHNLGAFPSVTVVDSANSVVTGNVTYINDNTVEIAFSSGFTGKAYLN